ncbi:MAG: anthranilate phosphoribosyltransferase, partial [Candidatus Omnitrophica bacterium]|nr:anthranilate phosphoribosyltransferase [Candidatus Omnitrophota bacterium]
AAEVMRKHVRKVKVKSEIIFDTCGTGGDSLSTVNVSTIAAFIIAGAGVVLAKHGNRSVSSRCGSADLLEALGVNIEAEASMAEECLEKIGIGFLFAPKLHPAMKYAMPVRKELGIRTVFNILGPLTNPAGATHQIMGIYNCDYGEKIARVLGNLGSVHALVVYGLDGLDEVSTASETIVWEWKEGDLNSYRITPEDYGIKRVSLDSLKAGDIGLNKEIALDVLGGKKGAYYDIAVLNAGCGLYAADRVKNIKEGVELAKNIVDSGKAREKLEQLRELTNR